MTTSILENVALTILTSIALTFLTGFPHHYALTGKEFLAYYGFIFFNTTIFLGICISALCLIDNRGPLSKSAHTKIFCVSMGLLIAQGLYFVWLAL